MVDCIVRKLKIRTDKRACLPAIVYLLEDALRTASFPGIPPNGVVYIKYMDLGRFDVNISSALLSGRIDAFVRTLRPVPAVTIRPDQTEETAVWFADELEPCRALAAHLAKGRSPSAWFWPVAVKGWSRRQPLSQNLQAIVFQAARHPAGITGLADVLEPLLHSDTLLNLLDSFEENQLFRLTVSLGLTDRQPLEHASTGPVVGPWQQHKPVTQSSSSGDLPPKDKERVAKALHRWGPQADQTILLTGLVLTVRRHQASPEAIRSTLAGVAALETWPPPRAHAKATPNHRNHPTQTVHLRTTAHDREPVGQTPPESVASRQAATSRPFIGNRADVTEVTPDKTSPATDGQRRHPHTGADHLEKQKYTGKISDTPRPAETSVAPLEKPPTISRSRLRTRQTEIPPSLPENRLTPPPSPCLARQLALRHPFAGAFTRFAGFPLLINALEELAIEAIFAGHPHAAQFPGTALRQAVLWRIARWQKIPAQDPAVHFLCDPEEIGVLTKRTFKLVSRRYLLENAVANRRRLFRIPRRHNPVAPLDFEQTAAVFALAVRRYVRHYAGLSVRELVRRPAFIALTKTHMDITAELKTLDIRIRLAGLDINPGWVPWLGKVVQIHYTEEKMNGSNNPY